MDGIINAGEYSSVVHVTRDAAAPTSNFSSPGATATSGYDIYLGDNGSSVLGAAKLTDGVAAGLFANFYFDLNPTVGDGSDLGFEVGTGGVTAFIPGKNGQPGFSTVLDASLYSVATGVDTIEFSLANSLFTHPIPGLAYYDGQTFEPTVEPRLSQSLNYSVAGVHLGTVDVGGVPEPASWALMIGGFGMAGAALRRRRQALAA